MTRTGSWSVHARGLKTVFGLLVAAALVTSPVFASKGRYLSTEDFLARVFGPNSEPQLAALVIDRERRSAVEKILGHRFPLLRLRYWHSGARTAWVIDEIGKTEPITIGVGIEGGLVTDLKVLEFREARGWEVKYPFFTDQFLGAGTGADYFLDRSIDGITGATLSVDAVTKAARLALYLHGQAQDSQPAASRAH